MSGKYIVRMDNVYTIDDDCIVIKTKQYYKMLNEISTLKTDVNRYKAKANYFKSQLKGKEL